MSESTETVKRKGGRKPTSQDEVVQSARRLLNLMQLHDVVDVSLDGEDGEKLEIRLTQKVGLITKTVLGPMGGSTFVSFVKHACSLEHARRRAVRDGGADPLGLAEAPSAPESAQTGS